MSYTWARTFDSGFPDGDGSYPGAMYWPLPGTKRADWGLSQLNVNDQFSASVLYDLPFGKGKRYGGDWSAVPNAIMGGWHVNVIERATSGFPLFITDSANNSGVNFQWNGSSLNRPIRPLVRNRSHPNIGPDPVATNPGCVAPAACPQLLQTWFNPCAFAPTAPAGELRHSYHVRLCTVRAS